MIQIFTDNKIDNIFQSFKEKKVLIIGDVMLDMYLWGNVDRISPEAPVPIVAVNHNECRLGGASNVALNIQTLGATPVICSVVGDDDKGSSFVKKLEKKNISSAGIIKSTERMTTIKTRIIGHNQQILRVDEEIDTELSPVDTNALMNKIKHFIHNNGIDVIIFQDYDKGVITPLLIEKVVTEAKKHQIPTSVDPKRRNFKYYKNVTLFKPNLKELKEGLKTDFNHNNIDELTEAVLKLQQSQQFEIALITLSEKGIYVCTNREQQLIAAYKRNVADVSGAGDTVISVASLCLSAGLTPVEIATIANMAGGLVCEEVGVVPINKEQLIEEIKI